VPLYESPYLPVALDVANLLRLGTSLGWLTWQGPTTHFTTFPPSTWVIALSLLATPVLGWDRPAAFAALGTHATPNAFWVPFTGALAWLLRAACNGPLLPRDACQDCGS
jgi:hypothetical protein